MLGVFNVYPWVMPAETQDFVSFFVENGVKKKYAKHQILEHGGKNGCVSMVEKGLLSFFFYDAFSRQNVFSLSPPRRTLGDLEALDGTTSYALAECLMETHMLVVSRKSFITYLRGNVDRMEQYAASANRKHQCVMEGMIATYTYPVPERLRLLLYSLIHSFEINYVNNYLQLPLELSVTDIARILSADRSWVSLTISAWKNEGYVRRTGKKFLVSPKLFAHPMIYQHFSREEKADRPK